MKKVFIYVGHSNWGKSMALKMLTGGSSHQKTVAISGINVRVRKMSNDDDENDKDGLLKWVQRFPNLNFERFVIALCPNIFPIQGKASFKENMATDILIELKKTNQLYFFVQEQKYSNPSMLISQNEINWLVNFGTVEILKGQHEHNVRAEKFELFVKTYI
jgi:hypothetical protein